MSFEKCWSIPHELLTQGSESPVQPPPPLLSACLGHIRIGRGGGSTSSLKMVPQVTPHLHHSLKPLFRKEEHKSTLNGRVRGCWQTLGLMISEASFMATRLQVRRKPITTQQRAGSLMPGRPPFFSIHGGKFTSFSLQMKQTNPDAQPVPLPERNGIPSPYHRSNHTGLPPVPPQ